MKIKEGFELRDVCGERVIVPVGLENIDFGKLINLNETAAFLFQTACLGAFTAETLAALLATEYDVAETEALRDTQALIAQWQIDGLLDE